MSAPHTAHETTSLDFNHLERGETYRAITHAETTVGEYLGIETLHGTWAILLRHGTGTDSIPLSCVTSILPLAA